MTRTVPSISAINASPLGSRASNNSSTRGKTVRDVFHAGDAARVERAERQLRARLADALRGDDADRFAHSDQAAAREIAPVAFRAQAVPRFARQRTADARFGHFCALSTVSMPLR